MTNKEKLLEFYKANLNALKCSVGEDGFITYAPTNDPLILEHGERELRVALPQDSILQLVSGGHVLAYHPLSENILLGQSPVINLMREVVNQSLSLNIMALVVTIASAVNLNTKFNIKQAEWLGGIEKVDDKFVNTMIKIAQQLEGKGDYRVINVYLKHGGLLHDTQYSRICTVNFPIYQHLLETPKELFGVKVRKGDVGLLINILERIIPHLDIKDHYSVGSVDLTAPYFDALMRAHAKVQEVLNKPGQLFKKLCYSLTEVEVKTDLSYIKQFDQFDQLKNAIPPLKYNQGMEPSGQVPAEPVPVAASVPAAPVPPAPAPSAPIPPAPAPVAPPPPQVQETPKSVNINKGLTITKLGADKNDGPNPNVVNTGFQQPAATQSLQQLAYPPEVYGVPQQPQYPAYPTAPQAAAYAPPPPPSYPAAPQGYPAPPPGYAPPPAAYAYPAPPPTTYAGGPTLSPGAPQPHYPAPTGYSQAAPQQPYYGVPQAPGTQYNNGYPVIGRR